MEVTPAVADLIAKLPDDMRLAVPGDAEIICRYYHASWLAGLDHLFPAGALEQTDPLDSLDRFRGWLEPESGFTTVVAQRDGVAIGHTTVHENELVHLFIDPTWFGNGLGSTLLGVGEGLLRAAGHDEIVLHTLVGNTRAVALYESKGWVLTDERAPGVYFGYNQTELTLIKVL